jgi:hypothetical protein
VHLGDFVRVLRWAYKSYGLEPERINQLEELPGWAWNKYDGDWLDYFERLSGFVMTHNRWPNSRLTDEKSLGMWIGTQRRYRDKLSTERITLLEALPGWSWDPLAEAWEEQRVLAMELFEKTGSILPPKLESERDKVLAAWIQVQKRVLKAGKMPDHRKKLLEPILNFLDVQSHEERATSTWNKNFLELQKFVKQHGHFSIPTSLPGVETELDRWLTRQRFMFRQKTLDESKISRLESLPGWTWEPNADTWEKYFKLLKEFNRENGHLLPIFGDSQGLKEWINGQRKIYKRGNYPANRATKLQSLTGWSWDPYELSFDSGISALVEYLKVHGNSNPGVNENQGNFPLGRWVRQQRINYSKGVLPPHLVTKLNEVPRWAWISK